eukprot:PITA_31780
MSWPVSTLHSSNSSLPDPWPPVSTPKSTLQTPEHLFQFNQIVSSLQQAALSNLQPPGGQSQGSSTVTSTSISSGVGDPRSSQQTKQQEQEEELIKPPTTSGRASREVRQTLRDGEEFVGAPRTNKRRHRQPNRYQALVAQVTEPSRFHEAAQHQVWVDAMVEEYNSIITNDVWEVVPRPEDRSVVGSRWIYKIKYIVDGSVEKYNARFMAKG